MMLRKDFMVRIYSFISVLGTNRMFFYAAYYIFSDSYRSQAIPLALTVVLSKHLNLKKTATFIRTLRSFIYIFRLRLHAAAVSLRES